MKAAVTAVLGPTNTGKTHLAVERMCAHSSGIMGFPLRLLAREVYDRVVKLKGADQVALVTGEEKIVPPNARWHLCTVESMPETDVAFVGLDEAQLGTDPERGHVPLRAGMHSGPCMAVVVGRTDPKYTLLGDTVNVASRMESTGAPGRVQCSARTAQLLKQQARPTP
jgi:hypothetical protein